MRRYSLFAVLACSLGLPLAFAEQAVPVSPEGGIVTQPTAQDEKLKVDLLPDMPKDSAEEVKVDVRTSVSDDKQSVQLASQDWFRAEDVIGMEVKNAQNEELGEIEDLAIDAKSGGIRYAALSFGGLGDLGDKLVALPWQSLKFTRDKDDNDTFILVDRTRPQLEQAQGFDDDHWPDTVTAKTESADHPTLGSSDAIGWVYRAETLEGLNLKNQQGETLGKVKDLLIDTQQGRVEFAAISTGMLGAGKLVAIPWTALEMERTRDDRSDGWLVLNTTPELLDQAPSLEDTDAETLAGQEWRQASERFFESHRDEIRQAERPARVE